MKKKYKLTLIHILVAAVFFLLGLNILITGTRKFEMDACDTSQVAVNYMSTGSYTVKIDYNNRYENNEIIIGSDSLRNEDMSLGVVLLRQEMNTGADSVEVSLDLSMPVTALYIRASQGTDENVFTHVYLREKTFACTDYILLAMLFWSIALITVMLGWYVPLERYKEPAIIFGLTVVTGIPLYSDFIGTAHDLTFHITRIEGLYQTMLAGEFPMRINPLQYGGFGNISGAMYPSLFVYPFALLRLCRVSTMLSYKLLVMSIQFVTALTAYYSVKAITKSSKIASVSCVLFALSIFRLKSVYLQAALGEAMAMAFMPLVIWGIYEVFYGDYKKKWFILTLGMTCVLESHVLSTESCIFFLCLEGILFLVLGRKEQLGGRVLAGIKATITTVLLNCSFIIPFLFFGRQGLWVFQKDSSTLFSGTYFSQLFAGFSNAQGVNVDLGATNMELPQTIGVATVIGVALFLFLCEKKKEERNQYGIGLHCLILGLLAVYMASWLFPWKAIYNHIEFMRPIIRSIQFLWRFLGTANLLLSITAAIGLVWFSQTDYQKWILGIAGAFVLISVIYYFDMNTWQTVKTNDKFQVESYRYEDDLYLLTEERIQNNNVPACDIFSWDKAEAKLVSGNRGIYSEFSRRGTKLHFTVETTEDDYLLLPLYYYPGYEVKINGETVPVLSMEGRVACSLNAGVSEVDAYYKGMWFFRVGDVISLVSVVITMVLVIYKKRKPLDFL